jgi:phage FluMu protein Com
MNCPSCGVPLNESVYTSDRLYKSCPRCSEKEGRHVFRKTEEYGERNNAGRQYIQSHCPACRSNREPPPAEFSCE